MINLEKETNTDIILTLKETTTLTGNVYYLIQFLDFEGAVVESFTPTEQSTTLDRYNKFTLNSSLAKGEYYYQVYQSNVENPTIDDVSGDPIEYGLVYVDSDEDLEDSVYL